MIYSKTTMMLAACAACALPAGCSADSNAVPPQSSALDAPLAEAAAPEGPAYPPGRWRLASLETLQLTVIPLSHILIRHEGSDRQAPATTIPWTPQPAPPRRTRAEALLRARELARLTSKNASDFAALAAQHSEDVTTAPRGGSLGALRAVDLYFSPTLLDALASMRPGAVSQVVETSAGFHILHRHAAMPEPAQLSGRRIVVGYVGAEGLVREVGMPNPTRTRAEAEVLAARLYREAKANPRSFGDLVQLHSEHGDKQQGGDFGNWSTREPTHLPREVNVLAHLDVGDVAPPLDSVYGFEIIQRTPDRAATSLGVEVARVRFDPSSRASEAAALERARALGASFAAHPASFDSFRRAECCIQPERWAVGRNPGMDATLATLKVGALFQPPLREYSAYALVRRISEQQLPPVPTPLFELPSPRSPDIATVVMDAPLTQLTGAIRSAAQRTRAELELNGEEAQALADIDRALAAADDDPWRKVAAVRDGVERVEQVLGGSRARRYREHLDSRLAAVVLGQPHPIAVE